MILLSGFFFISGLEEVIHHFLHPHNKTSDDSNSESTADYGSLTSHKTMASKIKETIRTAFTVSALSFHSVIEGGTKISNQFKNSKLITL